MGRPLTKDEKKALDQRAGCFFSVCFALTCSGLLFTSSLVAKLVENNNSNSNVNQSPSVGNYESNSSGYFGGDVKDATEEYYVFDLALAWKNAKYDTNNNFSVFLEDNLNYHYCTSGFADNVLIPRYILLSRSDLENSFKRDKNVPGFMFEKNSKDSFNISLNGVSVALSDEQRAYYAEQGIDASNFILYGNFETTSTYIKPLSALTKEEVFGLILSYGYNREVVKIVEHYWYGPLTGIISVPHTEDPEPTMSNGLTPQQNLEILMAVHALENTRENKARVLKQDARW